MVEVTQSYRGDQFYKIKLCPFLAEGRCRKGDGCRYAHSPAELCIRISLKKTKICEAWRHGKCFSADHECKFAHGEHELRCTADYYKTSICKFWIKGSCGAGDSCRHAHGADDLREMPAYRRRNIGVSGWKKKRSQEPTSSQCLTDLPSKLDVANDSYLPMPPAQYNTALHQALKRLTVQTQGQLDATRKLLGFDGSSPAFPLTTPMSEAVLSENGNGQWTTKTRTLMCSTPTDCALLERRSINPALDSDTSWALSRSAYTDLNSFFPFSVTKKNDPSAEYPYGTGYGSRSLEGEEAIGSHKSRFSPISTTTTATGLSEEDCFNYGCATEIVASESFNSSTRALFHIENNCKKVDEGDFLPTAGEKADLLNLVLNILPPHNGSNVPANPVKRVNEKHLFPHHVKEVHEDTCPLGEHNSGRDPRQSRIEHKHSACQTEVLTQHLLKGLLPGAKDFLARQHAFPSEALNNRSPLPSLLTDFGTPSSSSANDGIPRINPCGPIPSTLSSYFVDKCKTRHGPLTLSDELKSLWDMASNTSYHYPHSHQDPIGSTSLASSTLNPKIRETFPTLDLGLI